MAISPVNAAREGTWLTDDTEKSLFGSEPKFSVIRVKKRGVDSRISSFRNSWNSRRNQLELKCIERGAASECRRLLGAHILAN